jgi:hypothetical protein
MIINDNVNKYNPLETIFKYQLDDKELTTETLDIIQRELFLAGIVPENATEFNLVLNELREIRNKFYGKK